MQQVTLTKKTIDHSDSERFSFSFFCDRCGKEWASPEKPFSQGGFTVVEKEDALKLLCAHEHRAAFDEANMEAHLQFNRCHLCGKWVCDDCFCVERKTGGVCIHCK